MVKSCILSVTKSFGKRIVVYFQLGDLCVLVSSNCYKFGVWNWDGDLLLISRLENNLHPIFVHSVKKYLYVEEDIL